MIGKKGAEIDILKNELRNLTGKEIWIEVEEIKRPDLDAKLVADGIAKQLERTNPIPPNFEKSDADFDGCWRSWNQSARFPAGSAERKSLGSNGIKKGEFLFIHCALISIMRKGELKQPTDPLA